MSDSGDTSSTSSSSRRGSDTDTDSNYAIVRSQQANAYDDEPLAQPGQHEDEPEETDEDGLSPLTLEMRSNGRIPLSDWCKCQCCQTNLLAGMLEYRCCKEMIPAVTVMSFDGSIDKVQCITQHEDFPAMTNPTVLEHVGPLFKDRNGRSYRRRGNQTRNEFFRAVAYRWLIRWLCGIIGWDNSRPLPACIYHTVRTNYQTQDHQGYISSQMRT